MSNFDAGTASARFVLDDSQFQQAAGTVTSTLNSLASTFQGNYFGLAQLSRGFTELGGAMVGGFTLGVNAAVSWEQQMARLRALGTDFTQTAGQNKQALDAITSGLQHMAEVTPVPINDLAQIATKLAQVGTQQGLILPLTQAVANFGLVTGATADTVITNFTKIQSVIGASSAQMPQFLNAMFVAFKETGVSVDQLFQNLNILGPVLAELQGQMHASGAEAVFLATAMGNVPGQARSIRTAFADIGNGIAQALAGQAAPRLAELNTLLGTTKQSLQQAFTQDPVRVLIQLTDALDKAAPSTEELNNLLAGLGIKGNTVLPSVDALVRSTAHLGATQRDAITVLDELTAAYTRTTELQKATDTVTNTTAAHMTEFKNTLTVLEQTATSGVLPALSAILNVITTMMSGFTSLGPVVDGIVIGLVAITGAALLVAGRFISMTTQIVLARQAVLAITQAQQQKAKADVEEGEAQDVASQKTRTHTESIVAQGEAADIAKAKIEGLNAANETTPAAAGAGAAGAGAGGAVVAEQQALFTAEGEVTTEANAATAAQLELFGAETTVAEGAQIEVAALGEVAIAEQEVEAETTLMGALMDAALGPVGLLFAAVGLLAGGLFLLGQHSRSATQDTLALQQAETQLKGAIDSSTGAVTTNIQSSLVSILSTGRYADALKNLGLTADQVTASMLGDQVAQAAVSAALNSGGKDAKFLADSIVSLHDAIIKELGALRAKTEQQAADNASMDEQTKKQQAQADATQAAAQKANNANAAMVDYVHALESVRDASFSAQDAQQKLKEAEQAVANEAADAAKQQLEIESANLSVQKSTDQLVDAQRAQSEATQKASFALQDAQFQLEDANQKVADTTQSITDKQKALTNALNEGAKIANDVAKAENQIADARLREEESALAVQDAEYQINFLRGEGASSRDIEVAELNLQKARQQGADAATSVVDAEQNIADLATKQANDITKAQEDLNKAYEDRTKATEDVAKAQLNLNDVQADVSSGRAQRDADIAVQEAQIGIARAHAQVGTAELALQKIYDGSREEAVARAQNDLVKAYIAVADAQSKLQIDLDKINGKVVTSQDEANIYANALHGVAAELGGPLGASIDAIANKIRGVPIPPPIGPDLASGMDASTAKIIAGIDDATKHVTSDDDKMVVSAKASGDAIAASHFRTQEHLKLTWHVTDAELSGGMDSTGNKMVRDWTNHMNDLQAQHKRTAVEMTAIQEAALDKLIQNNDTAGAQILINTSTNHEALLAYMQQRWPKTSQIIAAATNDWKTDIDQTGINVTTRTGKMSDDLTSILEDRAHKPSKEKMDQMRTDIVGIVDSLGDQLHQHGFDSAMRMAKAIDEANPQLKGSMERAVQDMANGANADQEGDKIGNDFIGGFLNHLATHAQDFIDHVTGFFGNAVSAVGNFLGISSPSKVTMEMGEYVTQGFALGMMNQQQMVHDAARALASAATGDLSGSIISSNFGLGAAGGLGSGGSSSGTEQLDSQIKDLVNAIKQMSQGGGDNYHLTSVNGASASDVADAFMWRKWVRS